MDVKSFSCQQKSRNYTCFMDFRYLNKACLKDNFPTPFIDHIFDECERSKIISFMDGFSGYNQIQIWPEDEHNMVFICRRWTFAYRNMTFGLIKARATFQQAMSFTFHDLKHIVQAYLDDLAAHSQKRVDHPTHLGIFFERCHYYCILLNPNKCIFCVVLVHLLGFIVSNKGIMVDLLNVDEIVQFPPRRNIHQCRVYKERKFSFDVLFRTMLTSPRDSCTC
jgi:hypothetical protein